MYTLDINNTSPLRIDWMLMPQTKTPSYTHVSMYMV